MTWFEENTLRKRPMGVAILAALLAIYATLMLAVMVWAWTHPGKVHSWMTPESNIRIAVGAAFVLPLRALLAAAVSYSLWDLRSWARRGFVVFGALCLYDQTAALAFQLPTAGSASGFSTAYLLRVLVFILVAGYLNSPGVAGAFREPNELHQ
jgi:hypothetical protein